MPREENFNKVIKFFLRFLNESSRELKVGKIQKSKYCKNLKQWSALKATDSKNTQAVNKVEYGKCQKGL